MFKRIAVVNRGEAAMRLINAVREVNAEGGEQLETVALFTDGERTATFVREADLTYPLGPASARPYLDLAVLERASGSASRSSGRRRRRCASWATRSGPS